ncbi:MAG: MiaB/RimO family radical SAM methylthiotransferase, partial [Eggerthellaceae bacterium]|nr:MiaB/RimO family radical SAM methylthiotransferase [Eggerthellaceae bacterium]
MTADFSALTFFVVTYGCQMNKHDSERVCGMLELCGATEVSCFEEADVVVFMTCCVREAADVRLYGQVASIKNIPLREGSPVAKRIIYIGGCIGQRDGAELINRMRHVDVVFGTFNLGVLPGLISRVLAGERGIVAVQQEGSEFPTSLPTVREHAWAAWLPIMIGCNNFCTYCIVPYVRGREKSRPMEDIIAEARRYRDEGVLELTLLGQNVNSYGRDLFGEPRFAELLREIDGLGFPRLRFATSHPKDISDEVIAAFGTCKSLMPALHLPVQHGSNRILKLMNRVYTREAYLEKVAKLRSVRPDIALSTDIIVGFPGETEEDFRETL